MSADKHVGYSNARQKQMDTEQPHRFDHMMCSPHTNL
jgi:hypothetical protein